MGVAVASRYFALGSVVPWAMAGVGAIATQADVNVGYGPKAIDLLRQRRSSQQVSERLLAEDNFPDKDGRQFAIAGFILCCRNPYGHERAQMGGWENRYGRRSLQDRPIYGPEGAPLPFRAKPHWPLCSYPGAACRSAIIPVTKGEQCLH
jgi:hypothetical protein